MFSFLSPKKKIKFLHGNLVESEPGRFVAFFDEFPEIIAQGTTKDEAKERLLRGLLSILERKRNQSEGMPQVNSNKTKVTHFELSAAI